jgi:hypothetical protein
MKLTLDPQDLKTGNELVHIHDVKFEHFEETVQRAIRAVGCATFKEYGSPSPYKEIYPPKDEQHNGNLEVCERLMDWVEVPVYNEQLRDYRLQRRPKYHAQLEGKPSRWGCGVSRDEAIGRLVRAHPEMFGLKVTYLEGKLPR